MFLNPPGRLKSDIVPGKSLLSKRWGNHRDAFHRLEGRHCIDWRNREQDIFACAGTAPRNLVLFQLKLIDIKRLG